MGGKKKTNKTKGFTVAGEQVFAPRLSVPEEQMFKKIAARRRFAAELIAENNFELNGLVSSMIRRESIAKGTMGYFLQQFEGKYRRMDIVEGIAKAVLVPGPSGDEFTSSIFYLIGVAIWFLDYIKNSGLEGNLYAILPEEFDESIEWNMPVMADLMHSNDEILGVMTLIRNRKKEQRLAFKELCGLVDQETVDGLKKTFRDTLLDYVNRYLEICAHITPSRPFTSKNAAPFSMGSPSICDPFCPDISFDPSMQVKKQPEMSFLYDTQALVGKPSEVVQKNLYFRRSSDLLIGFKTPNPYDVCAAYLFLENDGDALVKLNTLTLNVLICATRRLPWCLDEALDYGRMFDEGTPDDELRYPYCPWENAEEECVPAPNLEKGDLLTEGQLFFLATGYILPRDRVPSSKLKKWFEDQGLSPERAECLAWGAYFASCIDDQLAKEDSDDPEDAEDAMDEEPIKDVMGEEPEKRQETEEREENREENYSACEAELTRQLKAAQSALHAAEREKRLLQKKLQEAEEESMRDRTELSRLRETLYTLRMNDESLEEAPEKEIQFPYQTEQRIAAFGGHDTWQKTIRPLLPGVRFFDRESLPDVNTVKSADVVWIQANAMPHTLYYRIINTARKENIPVRYFGFASARKCAEQLVLDELSAG